MTAAVLLAMSTAACITQASGPPTIVVDRTTCSHCGMLISEPTYAAAYQVRGQQARVFDDIGCLRDAARAEKLAPSQFWFHDASDGTWIDGREAVLVSAPEIRTPMGGGMLAHRDAVAAHAAARQYRGRIVTIQQLFSESNQ